MTNKPALLAFVVLVTVSLAGCDGNASKSSLPDETTTPWWVLVIVGGALLTLIVSFVTRGRSRRVSVAPASMTWKDHASAGYVAGRWVYDSLGEDLAIWRGNTQFEGTGTVASVATSSQAETWTQLSDRVDTATSHLYELEANAPDPRAAEIARGTVASLLALRSVIDARADARVAYRTVEGSALESPATLIEAREREVRSSTNLHAARTDLAHALDRLSTVR